MSLELLLYSSGLLELFDVLLLKGKVKVLFRFSWNTFDGFFLHNEILWMLLSFVGVEILDRLFLFIFRSRLN